MLMDYLTLTSVVFEFGFFAISKNFFIFNFNKCCIWIVLKTYKTKSGDNLTLTSVVFEYLIAK